MKIPSGHPEMHLKQAHNPLLTRSSETSNMKYEFQFFVVPFLKGDYSRRSELLLLSGKLSPSM
jgi:hypothetical protein